MTKLRYVLFPLCVLTASLFLFSIIAGAKEKEAVWDQTDFWFRDDDGTEISATGYGSPDTGKDTVIESVIPGAVLRLRFGLSLTDADGTIIPRLEFKQGTDCSAGIWTTISPTSNTLSLRLSGNFSDGDATTKQITNGSFVAGKILESTNPALSLSLPKNKNTEYEWSLAIASDIPLATTYSFRVTNNGAVLDTYEVCPSINYTVVNAYANTYHIANSIATY